MIDFENIKLRLIGFYNKPNQSMHEEDIEVESANQLSSLLKITFDQLTQNNKVDAVFKSVLMGNTVFILKDENNNLYAYYPYKNIARITGVKYDKRAVTPIPLEYKSWFIPGETIKISKSKNSPTGNSKRKATITTCGSDFLITKNGQTLPLDWDKDCQISFSQLNNLIEHPWLRLETYDTDEDCGDCDGYDYSNCDMSRCKNDCENCGGRRHICNNSCFNHRYSQALRFYINGDVVDKDLSHLIDILKLVAEPNKPQNRILFTQYHSELSKYYDECSFISDYFSNDTIFYFLSLMNKCSTLNKAREDIDYCTLFSLYVGSKRVFYGDIHSVICKDGAMFLPWKTYHIVNKSEPVYDKDSDSLVTFDYKLKFSSKADRNRFVELFEDEKIIAVYLSETPDSKKEIIKFVEK